MYLTSRYEEEEVKIEMVGTITRIYTLDDRSSAVIKFPAGPQVPPQVVRAQASRWIRYMEAQMPAPKARSDYRARASFRWKSVILQRP